MIQFIPGQRVHLVGIGGSGLSAIARILLAQGLQVSGSDRQDSPILALLREEGAEVFVGHAARNIRGAEMLIVSSAVPADQVEVVAAHERGIPVYKRSDIMAGLMRGYKGIAVAGTHGKTTTTAMITHTLMRCNRDPSFIVGGTMRPSGRNAGLGHGAHWVIEADEYDYMFLGLRPEIAVLTNVEYDHPDFFPTPKDLVDAFARFVALLPPQGLLVACMDDPATEVFIHNREVAQRPVISYGMAHTGADWRVVGLRQEGEYSVFDVQRGEIRVGTVRLKVPGIHNALNAMAALVVADYVGVNLNDAIEALGQFEGTDRRFEVRADVDGIAIIDDYAHHPTAIRMMLGVARARYPDRAVWAVWQPHTYSRVRELRKDFLSAFGDADGVIITEIYAAREQPVPGLTGRALVDSLEHPNAYYAADLDAAVGILLREVKAPAAVLIMSAGDAPRIGVDYLARREAGS